MLPRNVRTISTFALFTLLFSSCNFATSGKATSVPTTSAATQTPTETIFPTDTTAPTDTVVPTETVTATPSSPMIYATTNTNCRSGPASGYEPTSFLLAKDGPVPLLGVFDGGGWWYIQDPHNSKLRCWVWKQTTVAEGNVTILPFESAPPFIRISATGTNYIGSCHPNRVITVTGTITAEVPIEVYYHFETTTGITSITYSTNVIAGDTPVTSFGFSLASSSSGDIQVVEEYPVHFRSNPISFDIECK
jgi:hypothetical protein